MPKRYREEESTNPYARRMAILGIVVSTKAPVRTSDLVARFKVEPNLLAYDLRQLEEMGLVERGYGWVRRRIAAIEDIFAGSEYLARMGRAREAKERIAQYIAEKLIDAGDQVVFDAGTTAFLVGRFLVDLKKDVTIWTNNLPLFLYVLAHSNMVCNLVGGTASRAHAALVGDMAAYQIANVKFDVAVVTPKGLILQDLEKAMDGPFGDELARKELDASTVCLTLFNEDSAQHAYKRMMVQNANRVIIALDKEKFAAVGHPFLLIASVKPEAQAGAVRTRGAILPRGAVRSRGPLIEPAAEQAEIEIGTPPEVRVVTDATLEEVKKKNPGTKEELLEEWAKQSLVTVTPRSS